MTTETNTSDNKTTLFYLAPVRGITDRVYRNCFAELFPGIENAITPFVQAIKGNQVKPTHLVECDPAQNRMTIIPQIIGHDPNRFIDLARQLADIGNEAVNWNLGCPYPTMTKKRKGAGLLPYPEIIDRFLDQVCSKLSLRLSVKMRLGQEQPEECLAVIPVLNRYPLQHVTIHPRIGAQMYTGQVDLETLRVCCTQLKHPIIYSGDIFTADDYRCLSADFPQIRTWMLGRGLLQNPHLLQEIENGREISLSEKRAKLYLLHEALFAEYSQRLSGPTHQLQRMRDHWVYWSQSFPECEKYFKKIRRAKTLGKYLDQVDTILR
ncbi:tRNA dihydrouridine synthase [Planctomycetota bacterium]